MNIRNPYYGIDANQHDQPPAVTTVDILCYDQRIFMFMYLTKKDF